MDKGWGLTMGSDPIGLFANKPGNLSLTPRFGHNRGSMFPVTLQRREEQASPSPSDGNRVVVGEVDFFSDKNKSSDDHKKDFKTNSISVKKENSYGVDPKSDLDVNTGLRLLTANNSGSDQSTLEDGNEMAVLQAELERMNAENQRLRGMLSQVSNNYSALQMHLITLTQQQQQHQTASRAEPTHEHEMVEGRSDDKKNEVGGGSVVPRQFLELGPTAQTDDHQPSQSSSEERTPSVSLQNGKNDQATVLFDHQDKAKRVGREESPESEGWVPDKAPKLDPSSKSGVDDQPSGSEATMRKARVSVRARSEAPMISDGCQWRKYGQKMAKGNPCPRAYYRCTMAVGCPVRKQVQRCAEDRTILITTYEGTHNHPLPPAAVAMASTTSAAANMLLSGSMSSADGLMNPNFLARAILPSSSSMATISASAPFPTVTLDLTHNPNPLHFQRPPTQFQVPFAAAAAPAPPPPAVPQIFGQALYNKSQFSGLQLSQNIEPAQLAHHAPHPAQHPSFADTLSAATAAITADPKFTAALAAAISSIIGGGHSSANNPTTSNGNSFGSFQGNSK